MVHEAMAGRRNACKGLVGLGLSLAGCDGTGSLPAKGQASAGGAGRLPDTGEGEHEVIDLPASRTDGEVAVEAALARRKSVRAWTDADLSLEQIAQLLWAAQGITHGDGLRTSPSAGALYPLEIYALTPRLVYHYLPVDHRAQIVSNADLRTKLAAQEFVANGPVVFVIAGVASRTAAKYGDRAPRYVQLEAGHACHGLLLQAVCLGLGGTSVGAFDDAQIRSVVGLPDDHDPLYLVPVGVPAQVRTFGRSSPP